MKHAQFVRKLCAIRRAFARFQGETMVLCSRNSHLQPALAIVIEPMRIAGRSLTRHAILATAR